MTNDQIQASLRSLRKMLHQADEVSREIRLNIDHAEEAARLASIYLEKPNGHALDDLLGATDYQAGITDCWLEAAEKQANDLVIRLGSLRGTCKAVQSGIRSRS